MYKINEVIESKEIVTVHYSGIIIPQDRKEIADNIKFTNIKCRIVSFKSEN